MLNKLLTQVLRTDALPLVLSVMRRTDKANRPHRDSTEKTRVGVYTTKNVMA